MAKSNDNEETPNPWTVMERLTQAIEAIASRPDGGNSNMDVMEKLTNALARVSEAQIEGSKLIADETRRAARPSNLVYHNVSVFNRRGTLLEDYKKPPLKCIMMIPWLLEWESCTREEVELANLLESGEYAVKRIDGTKIRVTIQQEFKVDGVTPSRLTLTHDTAFNNDNFKLMPSLSEILRQILRQHSAEVRQLSAEVLSDEEEEALIEAGELQVSA